LEPFLLQDYNFTKKTSSLQKSYKETADTTS